MNFLSNSNSVKARLSSNHNNFVLSLADTYSSVSAETDLFVYNIGHDGGFVIVAGDDRVSTPVLGYSMSGSFNKNDMPDGLKWMIDGYVRGIEWMKTHNDVARKADGGQLDESGDIPEQLLTTVWSQTGEYAVLCPYQSYTGCTATSMAQIMKYWKWPSWGRGFHENGNHPEQFVDFYSHEYDWENMLNYYGFDDSETEVLAVATLMSDCGATLNMQYSNTGSGAWQMSIPRALTSYFKYKTTARFINRNDYEGNWDQMILDELKAGRPVSYGGTSFINGGHEFVCDGYASDGYFHFNFGFGGQYDGFYLTSSVPFDDIYGFNYDQGAVIGICPDKEGECAAESMVFTKTGEGTARLEYAIDIDGSITDVVIPEKVKIDGEECVVTEIGKYAFIECIELHSVSIPASVTNIGDYAFYDCKGLKDITDYAQSPQAVGQHTFTNFECTLHLTKNSIEAYEWAEFWAIFPKSGDILTNVAGGPLALIDDIPYENNFSTEIKQNEVAVFDANNDGQTWEYLKDIDFQNPSYYYKYSSKSANDWLITPGVYLEAGKMYRFAVEARAKKSNYPERINVKMSASPNVVGMTGDVIPTTVLSNMEYVEFSNEKISVQTSGYYYFGIHCISEPDQYYLYVKSIIIDKAMEPGVPQAVNDLAITPDKEGLLKAAVDFTIPTKSTLGENLDTGISAVATLSRNGETIATFSEIPGTKVSYQDDDVTINGNNIYSVRINHNGNNSRITESTAYIGVDKPMKVSNVKIADNITNIDISWDKVSNKGSKGLIVRPDDVTYEVWSMYESIDWMGDPILTLDQKLNDEPIKDTTFNYSINTNEGEQEYTYFGVKAVNVAGTSIYSEARILTGAPYSLPMTENFSEGKYHLFWNSSIFGYGIISFSGNGSDADGNCVHLESSYGPGTVSLQSGKIDFSDVSKPKLTFDVKMLTEYGLNESLAVKAVASDGSATDAINIPLTTDFVNQSVDLSEFANKTGWVRIEFDATLEDYTHVWIDNIKLVDDAITGIDNINDGATTIFNGNGNYNLSGQRVGDEYKGIVINNGHKLIKVGSINSPNK
ncbi:MAG: C10 family peptidase [Bacteroidaceae bacterium]|nr:C10 family peptidase [Bacteroidaceae bacterium]